MKHNHLTPCLIGIAAAVGLLVVSGVNGGTLVYVAFLLACPLMMVFMMRGMMHGGHGHAEHQHAGDTNDPAGRTR